MAVTHNGSMVPELYQVARVKRELYNTTTIELKAKNGSNKFSFAPGQFNMLYVHGIGEVPISISGNPSELKTVVHTTRAVGAVSNAICKLQSGATVGLRGPFGIGWPTKFSEGKDVVIVAGGIGLAPLRPALYHLLSHRDKYKKIVILYGARTPEDILYRKELEKWRARFDMEVQLTVDRAFTEWRGNVGVITTLIPKISVDTENAVAMVCGPEVMMHFTVMELQRSGIPTDKIFVSMERNMKCGIGLCGHCQYGPKFICKDGPVFPFDKIKNLFSIREL